MPNHSKTTTIVAIRLPNHIVAQVKERIDKRIDPVTLSSYLRERIIYDVTRRHTKWNGHEPNL